jgi:O-methyltransferase involved in polyketide biosynthesis
MPETSHQELSDVAETLLIPLYNRAMESQRPDAMVKDQRAVELVAQMSYDFDQVRKIRMNEGNKVGRIMLTRQMDCYARDFLSRHPDAVVVHIGCGLDSRFERVDNGRAEWYDLDLPDVIELRRKFIDDEGGRHHLLGCSVFDSVWLEDVKVHFQRRFLFLAENVFVYFTETQVKSLALRLRGHFPGAELVFDGWTPLFVYLGNRQLSNSKFAGFLRWGLWDVHDIEGWGNGVRLIDEWGFFDHPEPRMAPYRWIAPIFRLFKPICIYHFTLGEVAGEKHE